MTTADERPGRPVRDLPAAYLFDLDGVLVRTEELHFAAYRRAVAAAGLELRWSFERYCVAAHYGQERLRSELAEAVPGLVPDEAAWRELVAAKSSVYLDLLQGVPIELQPGAADTLERLTRTATPWAVVTNATRRQGELVRRRQPVLEGAAVWVVREDYDDAKPAPDAYLAALRRLGVSARFGLGFEDTPRGLQALAAAGVDAVLVTAIRYPELGAVPLLAIDSLADLPEGLLPAAGAG